MIELNEILLALSYFLTIDFFNSLLAASAACHVFTLLVSDFNQQSVALTLGRKRRRNIPKG
jgi:hypothetical protein